MRNRIGILCIVLGVICLLGSAGLIAYNRQESQNAANTSATLLDNVQRVMSEQGVEPSETPSKMPGLSVDGDECIGILSIPVLDVELPVLTNWSYAKLKKAPCHYYGSYNDKNFVVAAHNYDSHFGRLSQLQAGDVVVFTNVNGIAHNYKVVLLETLPPNATEAMIASGFDLSLYTCTFGGGSRVTVRCTAA